MFPGYQHCISFIAGGICAWLLGIATHNTAPSAVTEPNPALRAAPAPDKQVLATPANPAGHTTPVNAGPVAHLALGLPAIASAPSSGNQHERAYADVELTVADIPAELEPAEATAKSPEASEQQLALEALWQQQPENQEWTAATYEIALNLLKQSGAAGITVLHNSCKTSLCRIQIHYDDAQSERLLLTALARSEPQKWLGELRAFTEPDYNGGKQVTYFLGREEQPLP